jgi:hypothetical protein
MLFLMEENFKSKVHVILVGSFSPEDVSVTFTPGTFNLSSEAKELIETGWQEVTGFMKERGHSFYNGPLVRLESIESSHKLQLKLSNSITYKDVVGLRHHPYNKFSGFPRESLPNAACAATILRTADKLFAIGKRDWGDWETSFEISGGFLRIEEEGNIFQSSLNRLKDDWLLEPSDLASHSLRMVLKYPAINETQFIFDAVTNLNSQELSSRDSRYEEIRLIQSTGDIHDWHPPSKTALELALNEYLKEFC